MNGQPSTTIDVPAIRFSNVGKSINQRSILSDVRFEVAQGRTVAIVGVNGAGKTTLLRCLLDYIKPTSGSIEVFGLPSTLPAARERLAFLPERFVPPGHLTGHETLVWLAGLRGQAWSIEQSRQGLEQFAIDPLALQRPLRLFSKGMTQKIGLMATLLANTPLIVLDEPMSGLDPQARRYVSNALSTARQAGRTLLFTSHSMADVEHLANDMALIHQGELRFFGSPAALRERFDGASLDESFLQCIEAKELQCQP